MSCTITARLCIHSSSIREATPSSDKKALRELAAKANSPEGMHLRFPSRAAEGGGPKYYAIYALSSATSSAQQPTASLLTPAGTDRGTLLYLSLSPKAKTSPHSIRLPLIRGRNPFRRSPSRSGTYPDSSL